MMLRLNIVLAVLVLLSAVWLVRSSYDSRHLFVELERAKSQAHELQIDHERLEVDKRSQSASIRVADLAREKLKMVPRAAEHQGATVNLGASGAHGGQGQAAASGVQP
jgi:cell division protein FtsL